MTYPPASTAQWFQDNYPGADLNLSKNTMVVILHTTEGYSWPSYEGGATAPNYTGLPPVGGKRGHWRAHYPDNKSARALVNAPGGVETNTLNAVQLELIGTCDPKHKVSWGSKKAGKDYVFWPDANDAQLKWLSRILAYFHKAHGLQLVAKKEFLPYPASYGNSKVRLSFAEWRNSVGIYGHQHVPENVHGDPGNINIHRALYHAIAAVKAK